MLCVGSTHSVTATLGLPPLMGVCSPHLRCSGSQLLYMERALHCVRFQFSGSPRKRGLGCACILCIPRRSSSGSQGLEGRTLPGCGTPSPLRGPSLGFRRCQSGACTLCLAVTLSRMSTIQNLSKSLVRNWRPVCSAVGDAVSRAEPAPPPPPRGWAGPHRLAPLDLISPFVL